MTVVVPVSASDDIVQTDYIESEQGTSASWHTESIAHLTSNLSNVCGGDMGVWFYTPEVGLQDSFHKSESRKVYIECYEDDGQSNSPELARKYTGTFKITGKIYAPSTFVNTYTNSASIEPNSGLELYIKYKVATHWLDTSSTVRAGIMLYSYWAY